MTVNIMTGSIRRPGKCRLLSYKRISSIRERVWQVEDFSIALIFTIRNNLGHPTDFLSYVRYIEDRRAKDASMKPSSSS